MYISNSSTGFTQWPWKFWIMDNSHLWFLNICFFTYTAVKKLYLYICWCIISSLKTELILALSCQQVSFFPLHFLVSWNNPFFGRKSVFFHSHFCILKNAFKIIFYLFLSSSRVKFTYWFYQMLLDFSMFIIISFANNVHWFVPLQTFVIFFLFILLYWLVHLVQSWIELIISNFLILLPVLTGNFLYVFIKCNFCYGLFKYISFIRLRRFASIL